VARQPWVLNILCLYTSAPTDHEDDAMATATVNGARLFYDEQGSGEPLLFQHGYAGFHEQWEGVVSRLANRYRCIVMDARGAGQSEHTPDGYTIEQYAADVIGVANCLGLDRFTYVGHSMGGLIGMQLALDHPERLERLVLVAPAPSGGIRFPGADEYHALNADRRRRGAVEELLAERRALAARERTVEEHRREIERNFAVSDGHHESSWQSMLSIDLSARLGAIDVPTLMMAGAADGLLASNLEDFQRLPNATLHVFSRVGHGLPYEIPEEFTAVLADFLEHGVVTAATLQRNLQPQAGPARQ
jgi:pimeloyl-ACP methyl ester carboxylesterase